MNLSFMFFYEEIIFPFDFLAKCDTMAVFSACKP